MPWLNWMGFLFELAVVAGAPAAIAAKRSRNAYCLDLRQWMHQETAVLPPFCGEALLHALRSGQLELGRNRCVLVAVGRSGTDAAGKTVLRPLHTPGRGLVGARQETVLVAAQSTGRICYGLEIDTRYADVIVKRWQRLTGQVAVLEGDGRSFEEIAAERSAAKVEV